MVSHRDVAVLAAQFLQLDEVEQMFSNYFQTYEDEEGNVVNDYRAEDDPDAKLLFAAVKVAVNEISGDGFPLYRTVEAPATHGFITYDDIAQNDVLYVTCVEKDGEQVKFTSDSLGIKVGADGAYNVTYCRKTFDCIKYLEPVEVGLQISIFALAYCAARNYCIMTGRNEEASVWDQHYNDEIEKLRIRRRAVLPRRKWI